MSEWIKLYGAVFTHPKTRRVAKRLGIAPAAVVGHLASLWAFTAEFAPDGDLAGFDAEEVEIGAGWEGKEGAFIAAAKAAGYLDSGANGLVVHDWDDYGGKIVQARAVDRKRKAVQRASGVTPQDVQRTASGRPSPVRSRARDAGEREEREKRDLTPPTPPLPVDKSQREVAAEDRPKDRDEPSPLVSVCGPISKVVGLTRIEELLRDGSDLNTTAMMFLLRVDELAEKQLAELPDERRAEAKERCRRTAFARIAGSHLAKVEDGKPGIVNLPAYLTRAAKTAVLGDLVGDDLVRELRGSGRRRGAKRGDPVPIGETTAVGAYAQESAESFVGEGP